MSASRECRLGINEPHRARLRSVSKAVPTVVAALLIATGASPARAQDPAARERLEMVERQVAGRGISHPATLAAMREVPRHEFVPDALQGAAYDDRPLPIGLGQTISQPYMVAYMTELIEPAPGMRVLEVGTGSGYQAAVLAAAGARVYTIEIFEELATSARERLGRLGYADVDVRHGDGFDGWPEQAPFDAIIVTAAAGYVPPPLIEQLRAGGRMVIPVGSIYGVQNLVLVEKPPEGGTVRTRTLVAVRFVPLLRGPR
jgi:protein-L-isoaspartate(D-aspartate) O-methyltransferase